MPPFIPTTATPISITAPAPNQTNPSRNPQVAPRLVEYPKIERWALVGDRNERLLANWYGAARTGQLEKIRAVLANPQIGIDDKNSQEFTALMLASRHGNSDVVAELLRAGADVNCLDGEGLPALAHAVLGNHVQVVRQLLAVPGINVDCEYANGKPILIYAIERRLPLIVKALVSANANLETRTETGDTPLMLATRMRDAQLVMCLYEGGADLHARDPQGKTVLCIASEVNDPATLQILLDAMAVQGQRT